MRQNIYRRVGNFGIWLVISSVLLCLTGCEKSGEEMYKKAMTLYQAGKYQKAIQVFELLLKKYPDHGLALKAHYQLGNIYFSKLEQPHEALKHFQELYARSPHGKYSMRALERIGYIYDKSLNRCINAIEAYRKLIQDYSSEIEADEYQVAIGECYFKLGDYEQAIAEYKILSERYPESKYVAKTKFQIANSYALTEVYDKAIEIYEALLESDTLSEQLGVDTKLELAYCYKQTDQLTKALELYNELLELDSKSSFIDSDLIARKKERILQRIAESNRKPGKVDWKRRK